MSSFCIFGIDNVLASEYISCCIRCLSECMTAQYANLLLVPEMTICHGITLPGQRTRYLNDTLIN